VDLEFAAGVAGLLALRGCALETLNLNACQQCVVLTHLLRVGRQATAGDVSVSGRRSPPIRSTARPVGVRYGTTLLAGNASRHHDASFCMCSSCNSQFLVSTVALCWPILQVACVTLVASVPCG